LESGSYKEALLIFRAAILLDHPEDKLSLEDIDLVLAKLGRCFARAQMGDAHSSEPTGWREAQSFMLVLIKGL
jgi:hypothetical protein